MHNIHSGHARLTTIGHLRQERARSAQLFTGRLAPPGVSPRAFVVLSNLSSTAGQSQQQLADTLGIHRYNMVGLIGELEAAGCDGTAASGTGGPLTCA